MMLTSLAVRPLLVRPTGDIEITCLAQIVRRIGGRVDLMKLDIEGAEWELFDDPCSFDAVDIIRMEYHLGSGRTLRDVTNAAERLSLPIEKLAPDKHLAFCGCAVNKRQARCDADFRDHDHDTQSLRGSPPDLCGAEGPVSATGRGPDLRRRLHGRHGLDGRVANSPVSSCSRMQSARAPSPRAIGCCVLRPPTS